MRSAEQEQKLREIQEMARGFHGFLLTEFREELFEEGGALFLGRYYAESDRIYFGLNPGLAEEKPGFRVDLRETFNPPFCNDEEGNKTFAYWRNWSRFLSEPGHEHLNRWFNERVTSTFLVPWRTENGEELADLNEATQGKLYEYSGQLVRKMIEHHNARLVMVAGKVGIHLLNELLGAPWDPASLNAARQGSPGCYQWLQLTLDGVTVLQVPHFSRARSLVKLKPFADWLTKTLQPFGVAAG